MVVAEGSPGPAAHLALGRLSDRLRGCDHKPLRLKEGAQPRASLAPRAKAVLPRVPIEGEDIRHPPIPRKQAASTLSTLRAPPLL